MRFFFFFLYTRKKINKPRLIYNSFLPEALISVIDISQGVWQLGLFHSCSHWSYSLQNRVYWNQQTSFPHKRDSTSVVKHRSQGNHGTQKQQQPGLPVSLKNKKAGKSFSFHYDAGWDSIFTQDRLESWDKNPKPAHSAPLLCDSVGIWPPFHPG